MTPEAPRSAQVSLHFGSTIHLHVGNRTATPSAACIIYTANPLTRNPFRDPGSETQRRYRGSQRIKVATIGCKNNAITRYIACSGLSSCLERNLFASVPSHRIFRYDSFRSPAFMPQIARSNTHQPQKR